MKTSLQKPFTNNRQQADTGTKMIHIGKNTTSTIISKGISAGRGQNSYRGLVRIGRRADGARNYSQCDSLLIGDECGAHTFPYIDVKNSTAHMEHEASTSKIGEDQLFYCRQRGISADTALRLGRYFVSTAEFWMNLQTAYDLEVAERTSKREIERDVHPREVA